MLADCKVRAGDPTAPAHNIRKQKTQVGRGLHPRSSSRSQAGSGLRTSGKCKGLLVRLQRLRLAPFFCCRVQKAGTLQQKSRFSALRIAQNPKFDETEKIPDYPEFSTGVVTV